MSTVKTLTAYIKTKRFLLIRDDIEQCLIALRTQSVSEEISNVVNVLMSNAKKRPPSSELGNATKKKKVATKNQTAKKKTVPKKSSRAVGKRAQSPEISRLARVFVLKFSIEDLSRTHKLCSNI